MTTLHSRLAAVATAGLCALLAGAPAFAESIRFFTTFEPEAPGATGTGSSLVVFDTVAQTLSLSADWSGLSGDTTVAHIHCCVTAPGGTAGIAVSPPSLPGFPVGVRSGTYSVMLDLTNPSVFDFRSGFGGGTAAGASAALFAGLRSGTAYFNVHSQTFRGGEIRGFYREVPEPATWGLLALGATLIGAGVLRLRAGAPMDSAT